MDDIELDNIGEDQPVEPEEGEEEETNTDWRDESMIIMGGFNPEIQQEEKQDDRELGEIQGVRDR